MAGVPSGSSQDPNGDSREIQGTHGEKATSSRPGLQDNPQPQGPNQHAASVEGNRAMLGLPFPRKLSMIGEDDTFSSVCWNDGDTVIIEEDLFQREVLSQKGTDRIFETDSLKIHPPAEPLRIQQNMPQTSMRSAKYAQTPLWFTLQGTRE